MTRLPNVMRPGLHVDQIGRPEHVLFERRRRRHDLEGRSRLVEILDRAVAPRLFADAPVGVRVEGRVVRHREDLARVRIHDDGGAAGGAVLFDAGAQLALGDELEVLIDGQLEGRAGGGRALDLAEDALLPRVRLHEQLALPAAHLGVVRRLEAAETGVVETDVAEHVRGQLLVRIVAAALLEEPDPLQLELADPLLFVGRDLALEIRELAAAAQLLRHRLAVGRVALVERAAHRRRDGVGVLDLGGIGEDRVGVDTVGEHTTRRDRGFRRASRAR